MCTMYSYHGKPELDCHSFSTEYSLRISRVSGNNDQVIMTPWYNNNDPDPDRPDAGRVEVRPGHLVRQRARYELARAGIRAHHCWARSVRQSRGHSAEKLTDIL